MEVSIRVIHPEIILVARMETTGDAIAGSFSIYAKQAADITIRVDIDCTWSDASIWERCMRHNLDPVINGREGIVETRIRVHRDSEENETEKRIRDVLLQLLGIPENGYQE